MSLFYAEYLERLNELHQDVAQSIEDLSPEALDWDPGPGMNSLAVLVTHLCGAQRYWIGDVVGQDPSGRMRSTEFQVSGSSAQELAGLLERTLAHSEKILGSLVLADLDDYRQSPRDGQDYSVAWCLAHALEHTALHLGHIQIGRQLWDQQQAT